MDPCLVYRSNLRQVLAEDKVFLGYSYFGEAGRATVALLAQDAFFLYHFPVVNRLPHGFEFLDVPEGLSWTQSAQELQLVVVMLVILQEVDVNADLIDSLDIDLLQALEQLHLVDLLLQRMQLQVQGLVFLDDWAPEVQHFVHGVLLESSQGNHLFDVVHLAFEQLYAVV